MQGKLLSWVRTEFGAEPEYLWASDPDSAILRNPSGKWFGVFMRVEASKLGLPHPGKLRILNVKSDPALIDSLRTSPGFLPAWHMNKNSWVTILLDGTVPLASIQELISLSYALTEKKR